MSLDRRMDNTYILDIPGLPKHPVIMDLQFSFLGPELQGEKGSHEARSPAVVNCR